MNTIPPPATKAERDAEKARQKAMNVPFRMTLTPREVEALLEAAVAAEKRWNNPKWAFEKPAYPVRIALDSAIASLREALQ